MHWSARGLPPLCPVMTSGPRAVAPPACRQQTHSPPFTILIVGSPSALLFPHKTGARTRFPPSVSPMLLRPRLTQMPIPPFPPPTLPPRIPTLPVVRLRVTVPASNRTSRVMVLSAPPKTPHAPTTPSPHPPTQQRTTNQKIHIRPSVVPAGFMQRRVPLPLSPLLYRGYLHPLDPEQMHFILSLVLKP